MRLWTVQDPEVARALRSGRVHHARQGQGDVDHPEVFGPAYRWLADRFAEHVTAAPRGQRADGPAGEDLVALTAGEIRPVWWWANASLARRMARRNRRLDQSRATALIRADVPDDALLRVDGGAWGAVLNGAPVVAPCPRWREDPSGHWCDDCQQLLDDSDRLFDGADRERVAVTWDQAVDVDLPVRMLEVVTTRIDPRWVRRITVRGRSERR